MRSPESLVASAPVRIVDIGGWTDTWYAQSGRVCHIAVEPGAQVVLHWTGGDGTATADPIMVRLRAGVDDYSFAPGDRPGVHPLLEAVIAEVPPAASIELVVAAQVPPGSGLGTSAAVVVALLAVLRAARDEFVEPAALAAHAHAIETGLGWETGVQDQWAAAFGGIGHLEVDYPSVSRCSVDVSDVVVDQLQQRLVTVYLGHPHTSSEMHKTVISHLGDVGPSSPYGAMRRAADDAFAALSAGNLDGYGAAMTASTEAMRSIDPLLISAMSDTLIDIASQHGAVGWKVNGAGGDGGTITILGSPDAPRCAAMAAELDRAAHPGRVLVHTIANEGVRVAVHTAVI